MLIIKVKLKSNINMALRIAKKIDMRLHCIASHPRLRLHNDCMVWGCDYSMHPMRLHNTCVACKKEIIFKS